MKLGLVQPGLIPGDPKKNFHHIHAMMESMEEVDLFLLPELWNTGFIREEFSRELEDGRSFILPAMAAFARERKTPVMMGTLAIREEGQWRNRTYVLDERGEVAFTYDKAHLFTPTGEGEIFTPGSENGTFPLLGTTMGTVTCYDQRFPEWVRKLMYGGMRILLMPAMWPLSRIEQMQTMARAHAMTNQIFVAVVNGTKAPGERAMAGGGSVVYDPWGVELLKLGTEETTAVVDLDLSLLESSREFFNLWEDRRPQLYTGLDR
ncbi:MAG: nitrilase-related carbon-nitrogen hydrolase [Tissierellia bacterium]|nr:nitrilase-related carbon-nitrogen hydrolase [Tissierellia bacterium]